MLGFKAMRLDDGRSARIWHDNAHKATATADKKGRKHAESFTLQFEKEDLLERCALIYICAPTLPLFLLLLRCSRVQRAVRVCVFEYRYSYVLCVELLAQLVAISGGSGAHATRSGRQRQHEPLTAALCSAC